MEEDIEYLEQFIGIKKEYKYRPIKFKTLNNTRQAIENLIARNKELESDLYEANQIISEQIDIIANSVSKDEIKEVIQRIDYDVKKTREVKTEKNNSYCSNDYDKVRLKAYITKSNEIKRRLLELLNKGE